MQARARRFEAALLLGLLIAIFGCSSKVATITMFSTRNVEMSQPHDRLERVTETDRRLWLVFIPLGGSPSGLDAAQRIIEENGADYLTNVEVNEGGWSILALSGGWVEVAADPWRRTDARSGQPGGEPTTAPAN